MEPKSSAATVIYDETPRSLMNVIADERGVWIECGEMKRATGWELKPEGACLSESCVPIPAEQKNDFVLNRNNEQYFNFASLADLLGKPWAGDQKNRVWYFGTEQAARANALASLKAPNFTLPDLDGNLHSLSDHLGKKVFLVSWASW